MKECVFCKIINHEVPVSLVYEGNGLVVIKDINPKAPVHLLIMPITHISNLDGMDEDNANVLSNIMLKAKDLAKEYNISGNYRVVTNVGEMAGQTVMHMHFHLLGGWKNKEDVELELK